MSGLEGMMGANSTQGVAVLLFLVAFTFLGAAMFAGGSILLIFLFLVSLAASIWLFLKCKPWEHMDR
jgi:hypothetical protein